MCVCVCVWVWVWVWVCGCVGVWVCGCVCLFSRDPGTPCEIRARCAEHFRVGIGQSVCKSLIVLEMSMLPTFWFLFVCV